jgi:hypothetical protein
MYLIIHLQKDKDKRTHFHKDKLLIHLEKNTIIHLPKSNKNNN